MISNRSAIDMPPSVRVPPSSRPTKPPRLEHAADPEAPAGSPVPDRRRPLRRDLDDALLRDVLRIDEHGRQRAQPDTDGDPDRGLLGLRTAASGADVAEDLVPRPELAADDRAEHRQ